MPEYLPGILQPDPNPNPPLQGPSSFGRGGAGIAELAEGSESAAGIAGLVVLLGHSGDNLWRGGGHHQGIFGGRERRATVGAQLLSVGP